MGQNRAWVEVDLGQLRKNLNNLQNLVAPARIATVVKSEAYGHGLVPVAMALEKEAIWGACVVHPEEGVRLRQAGYQKPILVVGASFPEEMEEAVRHQVSLAVYDEKQAKDLSKIAVACGERALVHLKFDTGLSRLASSSSLAEEIYRSISTLPGLTIKGVYSHLADAEGLDQSFTLLQYRRFRDCLDTLKQCGLEPEWRHLGASAAGMLLPQARLNLVRVGISLYGYWPSPETKILHYGAKNDLAQRLEDTFSDREPQHIEPLFKPALSYRARVIQTKWLEAGDKVGYGCTFETQRKTKIAILPVGYAEGYDRHLSNQGEVLLHERRARVLGRVCMNLTVVDVTDIPNVEQGSIATLWGKTEKAELPVEEVANKIGTINYEVVTRIPASIPRVYL